MRIIHTSDWHLGRTLHGADLAEAHRLFFDWLAEQITARQVDLLLVSGDFFDRSVPTLGALETARLGLEKLIPLCPIVITTGNHDSAQRLGFFAPYLRQRLQIFSDLTGLTRPAAFQLADHPQLVKIWPIPYLHPDFYRHLLWDELDQDLGTEDDRTQLARSHQAVLSAALRRIGRTQQKLHATDHRDLPVQILPSSTSSNSPAHPIQPDNSRAEINLVMAHAFVTGGRDSDSERDLTVGTVPNLSAELFTTYGHLPQTSSSVLPPPPDYVALGHLHRPQLISSPHPDTQLRYSGSPVAFSFSEANDEKSVVFFDTEAEQLGIELLSCPIWRPLVRLQDSVELLLGERYLPYREHFVELTVTDRYRAPQLVARLKEVFPHLLALYQQSAGEENQAPAQARAQLLSDPRQLVNSFFTTQGQSELSTEELALLDEIYFALTEAEGK